MLSIGVDHPDSPEFAIIKRDLSKVTGANVSIRVNDKFMKAVEDNSDYLLRFPLDINLDEYNIDYGSLEYDKLIAIGVNEYVKKIKAKELWDVIIESNWLSAEPGILNFDKIINYDPTGVYPELKPVSTNPCQPKWATKITKDGITTMGDIEIGDEIWGESGWVNVVAKNSSGVKPVYSYRTTAGTFIGTDTHRLISKGEKIEAKYAENIDILAGPRIITKEKLDNNDIMAGLMIGDGTLFSREGGVKYLCIGEDDQDYFNSEIKELIIKHHPNIKSYAYEVETDIKNEELVRTWKRSIPSRYKFTNSHKIKGFLRGLYSANGSIVDKRVTLKTSSPILRDDVQLLLSSVGIRSYYTTNKPATVEHNNGIYTSKESYDVNITTDRSIFYEDIGFIQKYKMNKLKDTLGEVIDGVKTHNIIEVEYLGDEEVFNITVDNKTHTYWTGGVNVSNCGELPLGYLDSCRLILSNLYSSVINAFTDDAKIDYDKLYEVFYETQVLADNLVDLEIEAVDRILHKINSSYNIEGFKFEDVTEEWLIKQNDEFKLWWKIREIGANGRRSGTGITGYGDMMAALGLPYGDIETTEKVFKLKLKAELDASIDLAIMRGTFPIWDSHKEFYYGPSLKSGHITTSDLRLRGKNEWYDFIINEYPEQAHRMLNFGRRNSGISTIAPAGTVSIMTQTTSGVEPMFSPYYMRRRKCNPGESPDFIDDKGEKYINYTVLHHRMVDWAIINGFYKDRAELVGLPVSVVNDLYECSPWYNSTSASIDVDRRINTQALIQKYITSSISSTVNVPNETDKEVMSRGYMQAFKSGCKGLTYYREGSRSGILISDTEVNKNKVDSNEVKKRPKKISAKVIRFSNSGEKWVSVIGLVDDSPYEIFTGRLSELAIPNKIEDGFIIKEKEIHKAVDDEGVEYDKKVSRYDFMYVDKNGEEVTIEGLSKVFKEEYWDYAKLISGLLRHNMSVEHVIKQVINLSFGGDTISTWKNGVARALRKFIKDKESVGQVCPSCGEDSMINESGCSTCMSCGYSKCN